MKYWAISGLLLVAVAALVLRAGHLAQRPLHNDEAINAIKLDRLWSRGIYQYDPHEYHGPALYSLSLPVVGAASLFRPDQPDEVGFRSVSVVVGLGLILLLFLVVDGLGWPAVLLAAVWTGLSPALVDYRRYYIHEPLLVLATFLTLASFWRYTRHPGVVWAALAGGGVGLMYATKETFVFAMMAAVFGVEMTAAMDRPQDQSGEGRRHAAAGGGLPAATRRIGLAIRGIPAAHALAAIAAGLIVWVLLF